MLWVFRKLSIASNLEDDEDEVDEPLSATGAALSLPAWLWAA